MNMGVSISADLRRSKFDFLSKKWQTSVHDIFLFMYFPESQRNFEEVSISGFLIKQFLLVISELTSRSPSNHSCRKFWRKQYEWNFLSNFGQKFPAGVPKTFFTCKTDVFRGISTKEKIQFLTLFCFWVGKFVEFSSILFSTWPNDVSDNLVCLNDEYIKFQDWCSRDLFFLYVRRSFARVSSWKTHEHIFLADFVWKEMRADLKTDNVSREVFWGLFSGILIF